MNCCLMLILFCLWCFPITVVVFNGKLKKNVESCCCSLFLSAVSKIFRQLCHISSCDLAVKLAQDNAAV